MPEPEDREAYDKWCKYISSHFAFKSPQARSYFLTEAFEVFDAERGADPKYMPLDTVGDLDDSWNRCIVNSGSVSLTESYRHGLVNSAGNIYEESTYWWLLTFGRHFPRHMLRPKKDGSIIIKVEDLIIIDLMLAYILRNEMTKLIWHIMVEKNFSCIKMLSSAWRHFEASETFDEDEKEVLNLGEDEKKLLNTTDVACSSDATESKVVSPQGKK
uniref:Uncharacterized protein n=1 Tax=Oryza punctata TaxID=4537 RepID=A0A0E0KEQ0_ORYPU